MNIKCSYCSHEWTNSGASILKCPNCGQIVICPSAAQNKPHEILKDIVVAYGTQIFSDKVRLQGILADVTQNRKIRKIILLAVDDDIHSKLENSTNSGTTIKIESIKHIFATQNSLYKGPADYIVDSFAYALGIIPSIKNVALLELEKWFTENLDEPNFSVYEKEKPVEIVTPSPYLSVSKKKNAVSWTGSDISSLEVNLYVDNKFKKSYPFQNVQSGSLFITPNLTKKQKLDFDYTGYNGETKTEHIYYDPVIKNFGKKVKRTIITTALVAIAVVAIWFASANLREDYDNGNSQSLLIDEIDEIDTSVIPGTYKVKQKISGNESMQMYAEIEATEHNIFSITIHNDFGAQSYVFKISPDCSLSSDELGAGTFTHKEKFNKTTIVFTDKNSMVWEFIK
jgi:hypothetical protein